MHDSTVRMSSTALKQTAAASASNSSFFKHPLSESTCILFLVLFSVSTVIHVWQSIKFRMWWALPTLVVSGTLEILGWSSRLWLSKSPLALTPYEIQLVGTILGPTPLVAATFVILGKIINTLGSQYSRLSSKLYTILFLSVDCVCLIIQGVGGAIAANAVSQGMDPGRGGNIMLGGIVTQMVCILFFVGCGVEFFVRVHSRTPVRILAAPTTLKRGGLSLRDINMKTMIATLGFMTMCFLVRAVYRTCELAQGWDGDIITTEVYFDVCDGGMIVLAMYALNIAHPGFLLRKRGTFDFQDYAIHPLTRRSSSKSYPESIGTEGDSTFGDYKSANIPPNDLNTIGFPLEGIPNTVGRVMLHPNQDFYVLEILNTDCTISDDMRVQVFSRSGSSRFAVISCGQSSRGSHVRQHVYYLFPTYQYDIAYRGRVVRSIIVSDVPAISQTCLTCQC